MFSQNIFNTSSSKCIYILIVNYNGSEDTIKLLNSIESSNQENTSIKVIIIDNDSDKTDTDKILAFINNLKWVTLLKSESNIGYFPAFNIGLKYIENELPATVLLCNNDLIFDKDFFQLHKLKEYSEDTFVVAPNVITLNGVHQNPHLVSRINSFRKLLNEIYFYNYYTARILKFITGFLGNLRRNNKKNLSIESGFIHMGIGACYILRPVFFNHFMKVDDRVFLGGEEALLAGQLQKTEGKIYYNSSLIVHHAEGVSFSKMPSRWRYEASRKSYPTYKKYL